MASLFRLLPWLRPWKPLAFTNTDFPRIAPNVKIEEEHFPDYMASRYYPVQIGQVLQDRYQIVGKLGFGAYSTVWLARDLPGRQHVALKLFITAESIGEHLDNELGMYRRIAQTKSSHPGRRSIRQLLDSFDIDGPDGSHRCLVHPPLWDSVDTLLHRNPIRRLPPQIISVVLNHVLLALDFLHTECQMIHTDIKADNIMLAIGDDSVFTAFEEDEFNDPSPRKVLDDGRSIYLSRQLRMPKYLGAPVLCDFGSAVLGDVEHREDVQPDIYRAPEVILGASWSYPIDIWNVACMVWTNFEGGGLFSGLDPEEQRYCGRTHIAEIMALLGPPPAEHVRDGRESHRFFMESSDVQKDIALPAPKSLQEREISLEGEDQRKFLAMMDRMLQWDPAKRASAKELAEDDWIKLYR
ncbi:hypothetical protein SEUCBS139899_001540 [Sporothrix eucalyptigena]|uniref:non-specific serine/threonine protein kinase n=1 Tax=Sporothrix eucalyptigena TaxID=1812306 RepID=A0ABP0BKP0_9PEZI